MRDADQTELLIDDDLVSFQDGLSLNQKKRQTGWDENSKGRQAMEPVLESS
jgi:hypothetical protein